MPNDHTPSTTPSIKTNYTGISIFAGFSMYSLIFTKNVTASRPSNLSTKESAIISLTMIAYLYLQTMIISQREIHHRSDLDLAVDGDGLVFDRV